MRLMLEKLVELSELLGLRKEGQGIEMMAELRAHLLLVPHATNTQISMAILSSCKPFLEGNLLPHDTLLESHLWVLRKEPNVLSE